MNERNDMTNCFKLIRDTDKNEVSVMIKIVLVLLLKLIQLHLRSNECPVRHY